MRPVRALLIYIGGVFLLGALLAPWVYWLGLWAATQSPLLERLAEVPFHRYLNRCFLLLAVAGLWPFLRGIGVNSWRAVGIHQWNGNGHRLAAGFLLGLFTLGAIAAIALATGARQWDPRYATLGGKLAGIALSAILVSLLEELLFRGALYGSLRRVHHYRMALWLSSLFFAGVHFLQGVKSSGEINWTSGLNLLALMVARFSASELLIPGFFSLTLIGMALALAYQRTGNLYFSLGLHAGLVFWLKTFNSLTTPGPNTDSLFRISKNAYDGWLGLGMAAAAFLIIWLGLKRPGQANGNEP